MFMFTFGCLHSLVLFLTGNLLVGNLNATMGVTIAKSYPILCFVIAHKFRMMKFIL